MLSWFCLLSFLHFLTAFLSLKLYIYKDLDWIIPKCRCGISALFGQIHHDSRQHLKKKKKNHNFDADLGIFR